MDKLPQLFKNNRKWAKGRVERDPQFFTRLCLQQEPEYLWIGCSDSRVPANEIVGLESGELFVHRNVANCVIHTDLNCLCVLQYAVDILKVKHIIVTGHYGCGGVKAALENKPLGLIDAWLLNIKDIYRKHESQLKNLSPQDQLDKMCELNVQEQVANVCHTTVVQNAWKRGQELTVHGWIYRLEDGILHNLGLSISDASKTSTIYHRDMQ